MDELEQARKERDEAFTQFLKHSDQATKYDVKARNYRHKYIVASDQVRSLERDLLAFAIQAME